jgi:hypothetical protein
MKNSRARKDDEGLIFSDHNRACTVRRSHRTGRGQHIGADIVPKSSSSLLERVLFSLLPHLRFGELV